MTLAHGLILRPCTENQTYLHPIIATATATLITEKGKGEDRTCGGGGEVSSKNDWSASERLRLALAGAKPCWNGGMVPVVIYEGKSEER